MASSNEDISEKGLPVLNATHVEADTEAHLGVKTVEASEQVYGKYLKWFLYISCVLFRPSHIHSTLTSYFSDWESHATVTLLRV